MVAAKRAYASTIWGDIKRGRQPMDRQMFKAVVGVSNRNLEKNFDQIFENYQKTWSDVKNLGRIGFVPENDRDVILERMEAIPRMKDAKQKQDAWDRLEAMYPELFINA